MVTKVSVSLPAEDIEFVDRYARAENVRSRSAVFHRALQLLRESELESEYADATAEWLESDDASPWETTAADGV
ncbi:ribbon-helix-helix domain-containing protein [Jiangella asiatica]|uniref:Ribbon-helix-helix protein, CopG family n=1 Tax=Jiangella asiatica TaxID=2530372 RepID=A0A4V2Z2X1_9ACTN|nr:ribbon-helix-helix domain-containing protein [Jiangella asiatica]TDE10358.1 ribbon-helix-helix protein, CopG family [Jiangella asiatica]